MLPTQKKIFLKELNDASSNDAQIPATMVTKKLGFNFFLSKNMFFN
jgi:hypothetical protein